MLGEKVKVVLYSFGSDSKYKQKEIPIYRLQWMFCGLAENIS